MSEIKVRITQPDRWYSILIGEEFVVEEKGPNDYMILEGDHYGKFILKSDCEIISQ